MADSVQLRYPKRMSGSALPLPENWDHEKDIMMLVGEGANAMGQHFVANGVKRIFVVCPPPWDPGPIPAGVALIRSEQELSQWIQQRPQPANNIRILKTPGCSVPTEVTQRYIGVLQQAAQHQKDFLSTMFELGPLWAHNGIRNFAHVAQNLMIGDLETSFAGVPLILVGAGPSLEKNIELLKQAKGKAIILAVNRTLRSLQNAGIHPHFTIALEARDVRCQFEGIELEKIPGILLATTVDRNLFELEANRFISYYNQLHVDGWMFTAEDKRHEALSQGTVSHSAFSLGLRWGCDPIIFVGQDLSFSEGRYYHEGGADGETRAVYDEQIDRWQLHGYSKDLAKTLKGKETERFEGTMVPGHFDQDVPTSLTFAKYLSWFEDIAGQVNEKVSLYNCTEGGALISGMTHKPLSEVLSTLPDRALDVDQVLNDASLLSNQQARQDRMHAHLLQMTIDLGKAAALSKECLRLLGKIRKKPQMMPRLQKADAEFKQTLARVPVLGIATQEVLKNAAASRSQATSPNDVLNANKKMYSILSDRASRLHREAKVVCEQFAASTANT